MTTGNGDALERLRGIVETLVRGLVDVEDKVKVDVVPEEFHTNLTVSVAPSDFGKVVGKSGYNAEAIRFLIKAIGHKFGLPNCTVHVDDPNPSRGGRRRGERPGRPRFMDR